MTSNNSKRFANRETTVKGFSINTKTQEFKPFETKIAYTRSAEKAVNLVREKMDITDDAIIITVNEIINVTPKPIKYNDGKIYELSYSHFDDEQTAIDTANVDGTEMRAITWFEISGQIWAINSDGEYLTEFYADETPLNMTKVNAREFLKMSYGDFSGCKVLGVHNCTKHEKPMYCVITNENLQKCIDK